MTKCHRGGRCTSIQPFVPCCRYSASRSPGWRSASGCAPTWPFGGLPWLLLGYTQTPAVIACQIADITGVYGVSFCVALVNAWVALFVINRFSLRQLRHAGAMVLAVALLVLGYGWYRLEEKTTYPGPRVMVVQSNYPQSNSGAKGLDL